MLWIDALRKQLLGFVTSFPCFGQGDLGLYPKGQCLLLAIKPVRLPPKFRTMGLNEQVKPSRIGNFDGPLPRLSLPDFDIGEHVGIRSWC